MKQKWLYKWVPFPPHRWACFSHGNTSRSWEFSATVCPTWTRGSGAGLQAEGGLGRAAQHLHSCGRWRHCRIQQSEACWQWQTLTLQCFWDITTCELMSCPKKLSALLYRAMALQNPYKCKWLLSPQPFYHRLLLLFAIKPSGYQLWPNASYSSKNSP